MQLTCRQSLQTHSGCKCRQSGPSRKQCRNCPKTHHSQNSDTSGKSRLPSLGTPGPVCQDGLGYPPEQVPSCWLFVVQLLAPPPAPIVNTSPKRFGSLQDRKSV